MTRRSEIAPTGEPTSAAALAAGIKDFATAHAGAKAVIEYLGKRGARIELTGGDGGTGEMFVASTDLARSACETAGVTVDNGWEDELAELTRTDKDFWRAKTRRTLPR